MTIIYAHSFPLFATFRNIYSAICTKVSPTWRKLLASFVTFVFIYLWHGFYWFVMVWSLLNFVCVQIEHVGKALWRRQRYQRELNDWQRRLVALGGSQLFIPAAISNFYFFGGIEVGNVFMVRTYGWTSTGPIFSYVCLTAVCYCLYHTSEYIKLGEQKRMKSLKKESW